MKFLSVLNSVFFMIFLTVFSASFARADVPAAQWIPWSFVSQEIKKIPFDFHAVKPVWDFNFQDLHPQAQGLEALVKAEWSQIVTDRTGLQLQITGGAASLKVAGLTLHQVVRKNIGGNIIDIQIDATCGAMEIQIPQFSAQGSLGFQNQGTHFAPILSDLQIQIPENSWALTPLVCTGPSGLDQKITALLQDALNHPVTLQEILKGALAPEMQKQSDALWAALLASTDKNFHIDSTGTPGQAGFFIFGHLVSQQTEKIELPDLSSVPLSDSEPQLLLSNSGFVALARDRLTTLAPQKFNLQNIASFHSLMQSRFLQLFVWPDLWHFSKSWPFWLSTDLAQSKLDLKSQGQGKWSIQLQAAGIVQTDRKGQTWTYFNWGVGLSASLHPQVKDSQLLLSLESAKSNVRFDFDSVYADHFNASSRISSGVLKKVGQALFENRSVTVNLPTLTWQGQVWKLQDWIQQGDLILMNWK